MCVFWEKAHCRCVTCMCFWRKQRSSDCSFYIWLYLLVCLCLRVFDVFVVCVFRTSETGLVAWGKSKTNRWGQRDTTWTYEWHQEWRVCKVTLICYYPWRYCNIKVGWNDRVFTVRRLWGEIYQFCFKCHKQTETVSIMNETSCVTLATLFHWLLLTVPEDWTEHKCMFMWV